LEPIKQGNLLIGNRTRAKVVKNKVAPPFKQAEFDLIFGKGISREGCLVDLGSESEIIKKSGTWYSYGEERLGQGKENAKEFLRQHPELSSEIEMKIRLHYNLLPLQGNDENNDTGSNNENGVEETEPKIEKE
jgi:recombination protein RecA